MILVLDTEALWHRPFLDALQEAHARGLHETSLRVVLPAVAYAERRRQWVEGGKPLPDLDRVLALTGAELEPFGAAEADRIDHGGISREDWRAHARDFLIAAHTHGDRIAVTTDRGPAWRGVAVRSPGEAADAVRALLRPSAAG